MNNTTNIPEVLHAYNIYNKGNVQVGVSGDVTLPNLEAMTETLSGPGIAGEVEGVIAGFFKSMELEIPWAVIYGNFYDSLDFAKNTELMLRGSIQTENKGDGSIKEVPCRVVVRGKTKKAEFGKFTQGAKNENKTTTEVTYLKVEVDGETKAEIDKFNFVCNINGVDLLAAVRANI